MWLLFQVTLSPLPAPVSVSGMVRELHTNGYSDQLAWLEAYLTDEARDRTLDGVWEVCVLICMHVYVHVRLFVVVRNDHLN